MRTSAPECACIYIFIHKYTASPSLAGQVDKRAEGGKETGQFSDEISSRLEEQSTSENVEMRWFRMKLRSENQTPPRTQ